jgi:hypothetical protein
MSRAAKAVLVFVSMVLTPLIEIFAVRADYLVLLRSSSEVVRRHINELCALRWNASYVAVMRHHNTRERDETRQCFAKRSNIDRLPAARSSQQLDERDTSISGAAEHCLHPGQD